MRILTVFFMILMALPVGSQVESFYGGVHCKECPSESSSCMPRPDCVGTQLSNESFTGGVHCKHCPAEGTNCVPRPDCCPETGVEACDNRIVGASCLSDQSYGTCRIAPRNISFSCLCSPNRLDR